MQTEHQAKLVTPPQLDRGIIPRLWESYARDLLDVVVGFTAGETEQERLLEALEKILPRLRMLRENGSLAQELERANHVILARVLEDVRPEDGEPD